MNNKDLMKYVYEQRRIGKNNKQIATSLGMSMKHFLKEVGEVIGPKEQEKKLKDEKKEEPKKPVVKPAEEKNDNFDWME